LSSDDFEIGLDFTKVKHHLKKIKWPLILLVAIILFGIYLRSYHINYPTIGYHNMKEDHYLSLAINMRDSGNYLRTTWFDCNGNFINDYRADSYEACSGNWGEHPVAVWTLMIFMFIFGWKLWVARGVIVLFSVLTAIPIYLIIKRLTGDKEYLALLSSLIYVSLPLSIFFGRNVQMDAPSLFFSILAVYYFIKFFDENRTKDFIIGATALLFAAWFKMFTLMVFASLLFIIPFSQYKKYFTKFKDYKIEWIVVFIVIFLSAIWPAYISGAVMPFAKERGAVGVNGEWFGKNGWIDPTFSIISKEYWDNNKMILSAYVSDNYHWKGFWLAIFGFTLFLLKYKSRISKFAIGYALGILIYIPLMAYKWNGHNYYQFPFLMFAAMCIANVFYQTGVLLKALVSNEKAKIAIQLVPLIALLLLVAPFKESTQRMFNTQFFGQDVAGLYINQHTAKGEIFLLERGGQNEVSWTAQRFYYGVPNEVSELQWLEENKNLKYIAMTYSGVSTLQQKPIWEYISKNYEIAQIGFIQTAQGPQVYHVVLRKGGVYDTNQLSNKQAVLATTYEFSGKQKIPYYVIEQ
jgi:4-amino-4-deoxy-L-arabinose transferase-like glycosyltransferase